MYLTLFAILISLCIKNVLCEETRIKFLLLKDPNQEHVTDWFQNSLKKLETSNAKFDVMVENIEDEENTDKICDAFSEGATFVIDVTWSKSEIIRNLVVNVGVPFVSIDISISPMLKLLDAYLDYRKSTDAAFIFDDPSNVDQALYFWIGTTRLRMVISENIDGVTAQRLRDLRPTPNSFAVFANSSNMMNIFNFIQKENLLTLPERWNFAFLDFKDRNFDRGLIGNKSISLLTLNTEMCCSFLGLESCSCPEDFNMQKQTLAQAVDLLAKSINNLISENVDLNQFAQCNDTKFNEKIAKRFYELLNNYVDSSNSLFNKSGVLQVKLLGAIETGSNKGVKRVAYYNEQKGLVIIEKETIAPIKPFYRIGTTHAIPWSYQEKDPKTGQLKWTGYCIDFAQRLSEMMGFDYEIVPPKKGTFGKKRNGVWDGVVGDLVTGQTDLALTALIMTADREEVIDFIAPYFEQTGISIVMRKPVRKTSLFKFMTVLKLEVWLSIVGALIVTGFMVWFLDKYSPYSARNNKKAYPYPCREFTLKESFWFALTSFTPQGGGEAPKALSGRTLVAAYWLFVVLMLATFTANLAAFLTVERMQTPVQSLEQLARQSRINYTVVKNSDTHKFFINMKNAEDTLYRMWKELTLNASTDETQYRVWDYPIREQYGHILIAINDSMPVANAAEGFKKVNERTDADFAFIHDSSEIKYEISRNCNFTEVGEVFAEKPYAVAVQQGSHLQDDISRKILMLQKDRFFDSLQEKYWNHSKAGTCPGTDDSEGITLESLGGVFIATLFGLLLAMLTLAGEVIYYRRKRNVKPINGTAKEINPVKVIKQNMQEPITFGTTFKPVKEKEMPRISHITLYPKARNRLTNVN